MHGRGTLKQGSEVIFDGEFREGMKHGEAVFKTRNGTYQGNFENDYLEGGGSFIWNDGKAYEGEFRKTQFHGRGTIYYPSNQIAEGVWE